MKKQIINILLMLLTLSLPFAFSQTRKAIPAGRYEALSGVKTSHGQKGNDSISNLKDPMLSFWPEVIKHLPDGRRDGDFLLSGIFDPNLKSMLLQKGLRETKKITSDSVVVMSDNFTRDSGLFNSVKAKGVLVVFKTKSSLKEMFDSFLDFEILIYKTELDGNYFLLRHK